MGAKSRRKGASGEREAAHAMTAATGRTWQRTAGQCRAGGDLPDIERVDGLQGVWAEVKRGKRTNWRAAMRQADAATDGRPVLVLTRDDHGEWVAHVRVSDLPAVAAEVWSLHSVARDALSQRLAKGGKDGNG